MVLFKLILIVFILLAVISIVWSTMQTGISPMISSGKARQAMLSLIDRPDGAGLLIDLGSGWGTLVIALAHKFPHQQVIGYELSWLPWLVSLFLKFSFRLDNLVLYHKDFQKANLSNASVLFCYLFPGGMLSLEEKLIRELSNEMVVVSNTFALPSYEPLKIIKLDDFYQTPIYVYSFKPESDGATNKIKKMACLP